MAQHRGFKLLKSRRNKPGTGDFGWYGLADTARPPLLAVGADDLAATLDKIESYPAL